MTFLLRAQAPYVRLIFGAKNRQLSLENLYQWNSCEWNGIHSYETWIRIGFEIRTHGFESHFLIEPDA